MANTVLQVHLILVENVTMELQFFFKVVSVEFLERYFKFQRIMGLILFFFGTIMLVSPLSVLLNYFKWNTVKKVICI